MASTSFHKALIVAGAALFLLGLLQGVFVQSFANPRMGLSAHLTAVQSGMALMIVGTIWSAVSLTSRLLIITRRTIISGMYGLWIGLTISAVTGASGALPIAGAGHRGTSLGELCVSVIVLGSSGLMVLGWALFVAGLIRQPPSGNEA